MESTPPSPVTKTSFPFHSSKHLLQAAHADPDKFYTILKKLWDNSSAQASATAIAFAMQHDDKLEDTPVPQKKQELHALSGQELDKSASASSPPDKVQAPMLSGPIYGALVDFYSESDEHKVIRQLKDELVSLKRGPEIGHDTERSQEPLNSSSKPGPTAGAEGEPSTKKLKVEGKSKAKANEDDKEWLSSDANDDGTQHRLDKMDTNVDEEKTKGKSKARANEDDEEWLPSGVSTKVNKKKTEEKSKVKGNEDDEEWLPSGAAGGSQVGPDKMDTDVKEGEEDMKEYCFCRNLSYGQMIGCDNNQCAYEWFHVGCVGFKEPPKEEGAWYCPVCRTQAGLGMGQTAAEGN